MSDTVVELREVFCVHRTTEGDAAALQGTRLELARGELLCVLGPSGAGKSTLLRVIAGLQTPSAGIVSVLGFDVGRMGSRARSRLRHEQLGFLGQQAESALPPDLCLREAVALPLALRGVTRRARRARAAELLDAAALGDRADALPGELSGGERQRVALCAAVAHRPALLLADEPTGELDRSGADSVRSLISELAHSEQTSVILVSHDDASADIADRALRLRDGRIVEDLSHGRGALIVDRDGRLQLPSELLRVAGISGRVRVRAGYGGLFVMPAASEPEPARPSPAPPAPVERWSPARVELRAVSQSFKEARARRRVIDRVSHTFAPRSVTAVAGPSGTGKTTLLRIVAGLDRPEAGDVAIDGVHLENCGEEQLAMLRCRRVGYLAQEPTPVDFLSATENIVLVLRLRGWDGSLAAARAADALARVGLAERASQRVHRLSAGEGQRLALARAVAAAQGLLVVDEPTSRLDESNAAAVAELLAAAAAEEGQTVICATHDPAVIRRAEHVLTLPKRM